MALGIQVIVPGEKGELNKVRSQLEVPEGVDLEDTVAVLEAEHPEADIVVGTVEEPEPRQVEHSFSEGDFAIDYQGPTPSSEKNTVKIVELTGQRADEFMVDSDDKLVSEYDRNQFYPASDPVVGAVYVNLDNDDRTWYFPEGRLRDTETVDWP